MECCGQAMVLCAESPYGRRMRTVVNAGIRVAEWRCAVCGEKSYQGWIPPTWINATDRAVAPIREEMAAGGEALGD
jgi:hypothetical protein